MNNIMSANRLLLQRLSAAPTLQQIRPRHDQSIHRGITSLSSTRWGTNNKSSADADVVVHYQFTYPNKYFERRNSKSASLFSSIASTSPLDIPEVGTNRKPDDDMSETNSDENDASSSAGEKEKEEVSAAEAQVAEGSTTTTTAQADDNNAENEASQSSTDTSNSDGIPSDQVIRSGSVQWIE